MGLNLVETHVDLLQETQKNLSLKSCYKQRGIPMTINKTISGNTVTLALSGRLDTVTSTQLTDELEQSFEAGSINLILDFGDLNYISSAGLRVLLTTQKRVNALGTKLKIISVNDTVREIFDITGFSNVLEIA